jgi:hypothetical protein
MIYEMDGKCRKGNKCIQGFNPILGGKRSCARWEDDIKMYLKGMSCGSVDKYFDFCKEVSCGLL